MSCKYLCNQRCALSEQSIACIDEITLSQKEYERLVLLSKKSIFAQSTMSENGMLYRIARCNMKSLNTKELSDENQIAYFMKAIF